MAADLILRPAREHLSKAASCVAAARILPAGGAWEKATSSAYYACLHAARALLATVDVVSATHAGTHALLALHFVKDGPLTTALSRAYARLIKERELAGYSLACEIDEAAAREDVAAAAAILRPMLALLAERDPASGQATGAVRAELVALEAAFPPP